LDAGSLLKGAARDRIYNKIRDSQHILRRANMVTIEIHSRSFRCFLRRVGHPDYPEHSQRAARND
jgi:hypothetical protein